MITVEDLLRAFSLAYDTWLDPDTEREDPVPEYAGLIRQVVSDENAELKEENEELRGLARLFAGYVSHDRCEGCVCELRCDDGLIDECWQRTEIRRAARRLGIEVDA